MWKKNVKQKYDSYTIILSHKTDKAIHSLAVLYFTVLQKKRNYLPDFRKTQDYFVQGALT